MLVCSKCKLSLPKENFGKREETPRGHRSSCKVCIKESRKDYYKKYHIDNKVKKLSYAREYYSSEKGKEIGRKNRIIYKSKNRHVANSYNARRRFHREKACPKWLSPFDLDYMKNIYLQAQELTKMMSEQYEVDHIVPLIHPKVCGLHVPWNLNILTAYSNQAKGNKLTL